MTSTSSTKTATRRHLSGIVVSTKMAKTIVVRVDRRVAHAKYGKYFTLSTKLTAHDEAGLAKLGDLVELEETRPMSKTKRFRVLRVVTSA